MSQAPTQQSDCMELEWPLDGDHQTICAELVSAALWERRQGNTLLLPWSTVANICLIEKDTFLVGILIQKLLSWFDMAHMFFVDFEGLDLKNTNAAQTAKGILDVSPQAEH